MSKTMINPQAIEPSWGGVKCFAFSDSDPDNVEALYDELVQVAQGKKYVSVLVYDEVDRIYLGDCELVSVGNYTITIRQVKVNLTNKEIQEYNYYIHKKGEYERIKRTLTL